MTRCLNCMKTYGDGFDICPHCGFIRGTLPEEAYHLHPGMMLANRYVMGTVLGFGGFGISYRAWDTKLEKMVAIKEYYPNGIVNRMPGEKEVIIFSGNREKEFVNGKKRFLDEARNMARFSTHPNIVHVFDFFEENHTAYIVMEFLDGISFKQYIREHNGQVDIDRAVDVVMSVLEALKAIHKARIVHRDISPDNIFICRGGTIKLIDFGAARFSSGEEEKTLSIVLKPGYAPPEQYRSRSRQGPWTDIYAVGGVLYRAITGRMPDESVNRKVKDELKEPKEWRPEIPDYLNVAIMRAMAVDQELRFKTVEEFGDALKDKQKILGVQEELERRKKRRIGKSALLAACIMLAGVGCYGLFQKKNEEALLKPAALDIWLTEGEGKAQVFDEMTREFREKNSQIILNITYLAEDEYNETLRQTLNTENGPDLFESGYLDDSYMDRLEPLNEVLTEEEKSGYFFLSSPEYFPEQKKLPLSFGIPVLYVNEIMTVGRKGAPLTAREMDEGENRGFTVNPDELSNYAAAMSDPDLSVLKRQDYVRRSGKKDLETLREDAYKAFAEKKTAYYFSGTSDYGRIKTDMAGRYTIRFPERENVLGTFTDIMSVNAKSPEEEKKAAIRLLYYLLSERAQDAMAVQGKRGLPLNRKTYGNYLELNKEFTILPEEIEMYRFDPKGQGGMRDTYFEKLIK